MLPDILDDPEEGVAPAIAQLQPILRAGVALDDVVSPWCLRIARIVFHEPWRYYPSPLGDPGYIFAVVDDGLVDLAGWHPRSGRIGTRLGVGAALGEGQVGRDGAGTTGLPLPVWRSPLEWLRHGRHGLVIVDPEPAAHRLSGLSLLAEDGRHGADLRAALRLPPPLVFLQVEREIEEAA